MFKTETHLHTKEVSGCCQVPAETMVRMYHEAGYHTLFITDHFRAERYMDYPNLPYTEAVWHYMEGYRIAKKTGDELGVTVLPAAEINLRWEPNDFLVYGENLVDFLSYDATMLDFRFEEFINVARKFGMLIIQAHPFRGNCTPVPTLVDGIEVLNTATHHNDYTCESELKATLVANEYHLLKTCGGDSHHVEDVNRGGICTPEPIESIADYRRALESGNYVCLKNLVN